MCHKGTPGRHDPDDDAAEKNKIVVALLWKSDSGSATSINDLAVALDRDEFEVVFIFLQSRGDKPSRMEETNRVYYLPEGWTGVTRFLPTLVRLTRILRKHRVDVLHCHNHKANFYGVLAGLIAGTRAVLVQFHGLRRTRGLRRRIENLLILRKAARIIGVSGAVTQDVVDSNWRVSPQRLVVLENSVDYDRFSQTGVSKAEARLMLGLPADAVVFGTIARLTPTKGLPYLIDAFCRVKQRIPLAHLVLLGDGPDEATLKQQAQDTPHRSSIHFLGYRPNIEQLIGGLDVFVLSSVAEGMPRVILEAMVVGVPCVCTAVGGIPAMVDYGRLGRLAPPRDAEGLAQAMWEVATLPSRERERLIDTARQHVKEHYAHDVVKNKLASLYRESAERESPVLAHSSRG